MSEIDFVVTWVDDKDLSWQKEKSKWSQLNNNEANKSGRYRDWDFLRYWFRAVEKYAPWVGTVFFVTAGHIPHWLNTECSKLKVIRHDEFIPEKYLPTFSSRPIELNLHRIPGLPEKFVYFNDDMFLNNHVEMNLFFRDDLPCDFIQMNHIVFDSYSDKFNHTLANNEAVINENFTVRDIRKHIRLIANFTYPIEDNFRNMLFYGINTY